MQNLFKIFARGKILQVVAAVVVGLAVGSYVSPVAGLVAGIVVGLTKEIVFVVGALAAAIFINEAM